jgi:hypothetical protein
MKKGRVDEISVLPAFCMACRGKQLYRAKLNLIPGEPQFRAVKVKCRVCGQGETEHLTTIEEGS